MHLHFVLFPLLVVGEFNIYLFRDGQKWFARPLLEDKDETWKEEILSLVSEVPYFSKET